MKELASKVISIKSQIEKDFEALNEQKLKIFFEKYREDKRAFTFIEYYNRTVLDKEKVGFGEFKNHCCKIRKEASFCSKLFHTIIPDEFPPVDNQIRKKFHLENEKFIESVLIIKEGYRLFINANKDKISLIRTILSKPKFTYVRIKELSDIRILDMYYWLKLNRS